MSHQARFLEIAKSYEALQEQIAQIREELAQSLAELGVGTYVQDPETGLVYKVAKPNGTFIYFKDIDYIRTAKPSERAGTLSKKEAEAAGFKLTPGAAS